MVNDQIQEDQTFLVNDKEYPAITIRIAKAMLHSKDITGKKLSWSALAKAVGLTAQAPISWKRGQVSKDTLEKIAAHTGVNPLWLITGDGEMLGTATDGEQQDLIIPSNLMEVADKATEHAFKKFILKKHSEYDPDIHKDIIELFGEEIFDPEALNKKFKIVINHPKPGESQLPDLIAEVNGKEYPIDVKKIKNKYNYKILSDYIKDEIVDSFKMDKNVSKIENKGGVKLVPVISFVQAGNFKEAIINAQDEFVASYADRLGNDSFALVIKGDSMSPEFKPGDKIIVDPEVNPQPGDYVIAQNDGHEATFKKYRPRGYDEHGNEFFELVPLNENYPILDSKIQKIRIIGTVVEHIRALRR